MSVVTRTRCWEVQWPGGEHQHTAKGQATAHVRTLLTEGVPRDEITLVLVETYEQRTLLPTPLPARKPKKRPRKARAKATKGRAQATTTRTRKVEA